LVRAYALGQDRKYLDALSLNADWHLGCNQDGLAARMVSP
jgi:hypothetical protein